MASTNSYNFVVTRDQLITDALLHIGVLSEGGSPSSNQLTECSRLLNMIAKLRAADGMPGWAMKRGVILPVTGTSSVRTTSHIVQAGSYVETAISADEASGQTVLSIESETGISASDQIGIELDDATMHWTTVSSTGTGTVTIASAITAAASDGNKVYAYTASSDRIPRPLRVVEANRYNTTSDTRSIIGIISRAEYFDLANPTSASMPLQLYYDNTMGDNTADPTSATTWYGEFFIYPRFSGGDETIEFTYQRPFQDFDAASDHPDFPQEFYLPIMLELAALAGGRYGVPRDVRQDLKNEAKEYLMQALTTVAPEGSLQITPNHDA